MEIENEKTWECWTLSEYDTLEQAERCGVTLSEDEIEEVARKFAYSGEAERLIRRKPITDSDRSRSLFRALPEWP